MPSLIVYYSMGGNTEFAAQSIAKAMGADLLRLAPEKAYPSRGVRKFLWGGKSAVMEETPPLAPYSFNGAAYDQIIFGFPVWAGNMAPPLRTFLKENDLRGKRIAAFACQSGSGAEKAFGKLKTALGVERLEATLILIDPKDKPQEKNSELIRDFCQKLNGG